MLLLTGHLRKGLSQSLLLSEDFSTLSLKLTQLGLEKVNLRAGVFLQLLKLTVELRDGLFGDLSLEY